MPLQIQLNYNKIVMTNDQCQEINIKVGAKYHCSDTGLSDTVNLLMIIIVEGERGWENEKE